MGAFDSSASGKNVSAERRSPTACGAKLEESMTGTTNAEPTDQVKAILWQAIEQAPDVILICDRHGMIEYANDRVQTILGYKPQELVGEAVEVLVADAIRGRHRAHRVRYIADPTPRPMGVGLELTALHRDGHRVPVEISLATVQDSSVHVIAVIRDMTEQRGAERAVRETLAMLEATHDIVFVFDAQSLRFNYVNEATCRQTGYGRERLLTMTPLHILASTTPEDFARTIEPLLSGTADLIEFQSRLMSVDGHEFFVDGALQVVASSSETMSIMAVVRDISERRELLDAIEQQRDHLALVVDAFRDGLLEVDFENNKLLRVNERLCQMVGFAEIEILEGSCPPSWMQQHEFAAVRNQMLTHDEGTYEVALAKKGGYTFPARLTAARIAEPDGRKLCLLVFHDLTEERRAAAELDEAHSRLAISDDRERIARDLHDTVIQRLFATGMSLQAAANRPNPQPRIERAVAGIDEAIRYLRSSIFSIRKNNDQMALVEAVTSLAQEARRILPCPLTVTIDPAVEPEVDANLGEDVVALIRESLTNAAKHAQPTNVALVITTHGDLLSIRISDDGIGFDPAVSNGGNGVRNLRNRAELLGGRCNIDSSSATGTTIEFLLPLR
jgi:PAS domain S-box-containing protein